MGCCGWQETDRVPTVPVAAPAASAADVILTRRARAEADLTAATGGAPVCRVGGERMTTTKHAEGRAAAMGEVLRELRRPEGSPPARQAVASALARWREAAETSPRLGPAWVAYRRGGQDELEALADELVQRRL